MNKNKKVYVIDRIEHGNGGVLGTQVLDYIPLRLALKRTPRNYGAHKKMWGFYPVICSTTDSDNTVLYYWNDEDNIWEENL